MIEYVIYNNPDDRVLDRAKLAIDQGKLICFPTDTNWIIAGSPYDKNALEKIYRLKNESKSKHFSVLCPDISTASNVAEISDHAFRLIKPNIPGHYTFIFPATKKITKVLKASKTDKEIGIRFTPCELAQKILKQVGNVLISTNITHEMLRINEDDAIYSYLIEEQLSHQLAMIIDPGEVEFAGQSTIIDFSQSDNPELVREGAGPVHPFGL